MAEYSYFWSGHTVGDKGPYTSDQFAEFHRLLMQSDRTLQGPLLFQGNQLNLTIKNGTTVTLDTGSALVDGNLYVNSAAKDLSIAIPGGATQYYTVILRKSWAAQTVRVVLLGPQGGTPPTVTQTPSTTWEIALWTISITSGDAVTITDVRNFCVFSEQIRNSNILWDLFQTKGDLIVASGANAAARLAVGSDFKILQARAAATYGLEWALPISCRVIGPAAVSISNNSSTVLTTFALESGETDPYAFYNAGAPDRLTIPSGMSGVYLIGAELSWAADAVNDTLREIELNFVTASPFQIYDHTNSPDTSAIVYQTICWMTSMTAAEYIQLKVRQVCGGALNVVYPRLWIMRAR